MKSLTKTLTALIIALASISTAYASELETNDSNTVRLPAIDTITIALNDDGLPGGGECKAVCPLPAGFGED